MRYASAVSTSAVPASAVPASVKANTASAARATAAKSAKRGLMKKAFKLIVMLVLTFAPAGVAAKVLGVLGRGPLRYILAIVLEPLIRKLLTALLGRHARESNETITK